MTAFLTIIRVLCDWCGDWRDEAVGAPDVAAARELARRAGWRVAAGADQPPSADPGLPDQCDRCRRELAALSTGSPASPLRTAV
ncbi:MAG: hypothetical protein LBE08_02255 [Bifidobacteriaceae bacterium]|jgi:hypothetical protein|nr:hypothetical protein [Bifidobacteriaceae bacterium]